MRKGEKVGLVAMASKKTGATWMFEFKLFLRTQFADKSAKHNTTHFHLCLGLFIQATGGTPLLLNGFWLSGLVSPPRSPGTKQRGAWLSSTELRTGGGTAVSGPNMKPRALWVWKADRQHSFLSFQCHVCTTTTPPPWIAFKVIIVFLWNGFLTTPNCVSRL